MDIYSQNILDHYKNPRNFGKISKPSASQYEANLTCGDIFDIDLKIEKGKTQ